MERRERLVSLFHEVQSGYKTPDEAWGMVSRYLKPIEAVEPVANYKPRSLLEIFQDAQKPESGKVINLPWRRLNAYMGGLREGRLIVIGGETGHGKTALAINIGNALSVDEVVTIYSLEMTGEEVMYRCFANLSGVTEDDLAGYMRILQGDVEANSLFLSEGEKLDIEQAVQKMSERHLIIDDSADDSIDRILKKIEDDTESTVIIVDHIHLVSGGNENRTLDLDKITRTLKNIAMRRKIPVIALCQLKNRPHNVSQFMPTLGDIYWCGAIKQHANQVLFIHDRDQLDGQICIKLAKNRHGRISGDLAFKWDAPLCRLSEWE